MDDGAAGHQAGVAAQHPQLARGRGVPEPQGAVRTGQQQALVVRGEHAAMHYRTDGGMPDALSGGQIP